MGENVVYNVSNDFVDHIKAVENQTAIPENADVSVDNSKSTLVRKKSDPTYDKNRGNTCNDPMAVMTENGTCQCFELMEDVGQGCRYHQPFALIRLFNYMLHNASWVEDHNGDHF